MNRIILICNLCLLSVAAQAQTPVLDSLPPGSTIMIERQPNPPKPRKTNEISAAVQCAVQADAMTLKGKGRADYIEECLND